MIEANRSIDGVSPLHEAQLRNSLRWDCSMHQQLSGKFCLLFEPDTSWCLASKLRHFPSFYPPSTYDTIRHRWRLPCCGPEKKKSWERVLARFFTLCIFSGAFRLFGAFDPWRCKTYWIVHNVVFACLRFGAWPFLVLQCAQNWLLLTGIESSKPARPCPSI